MKMTFCNNTAPLGKGLLSTAALSALAFAVPAHAASVVNLSLVVDPVAKTWQAYGTINDPNSAGFDSLTLDVTSTGTILVPAAGSASKMPASASGYDDSIGNAVDVGFLLFHSTSAVNSQDLRFTYSQNVTFVNDDPSGHGYQNIVAGFGQPGMSSAILPVSDGTSTKTVAWGDPALLATGKYTGTSGTLSVGLIDSGNSFNILNSNYIGAAGPDGNVPVLNHGADSVVPATFVIAAPEPAALGLIAVGSLGMLARRRKA
jgi:hypothetical protein